MHHRNKFVNIGQTVAEISRFFCDFQDGGRRHLGFSNIWNFNGRSAVMANECASRCQISSKLVKRLQRCGDLTDFSKCQPSAPLSCICFELTGTTHDDYLVVSIGHQCGSFDNMILSIFRLFGLQAPIQVPKIGVVGSPQNQEQY